jgi:tetratricopeptide (TPR) repeat protein
MFKMTTSILIMEKKTPESDAKQELISFASQYWFEYLDDIPMNINTKSENARIVVECIGDIFTHKEGEYIALKRMDKALNINKYRPSICGRSVDAAKKRAERVSKWAETGLQLEGPEKIRKTLEILKTGAGRVLLRVARAHVDNWSEAEHPLEAHASFRLAYRAIRDAYEVQPEFAKQYEKKFGKKGEPDPEVFKPELFFAVSDDFGEWSKDETATECRCRSLALRYECHYKQALEQAQRGLSEAQKSGNKREEFDLWLRVGRICLGMSEDLKRIHSMFPKIGLLLDFVKRLLDEVAKSPGDREKSLDKSNPHPEMSVQTKIETLLKESVGEDSKKVSPDATYKRALNIGCLAAVEKAVSMGEEVREEAKRRGEGRAKSRSWEGKINNAYQLKIRAEILLQKFDDAMSTIGTTLKNNPDTSLIYFDDIVDFMGKEAEWEDISRLLGKVSKKQLVKGCKTSTHKFIQRAARISGGDDHLDELYNEAIKSLQKPPNPGPLNSMRLWYAIFEWSSSDSQKRATAEKLLNLARSPTEGGGIGVMTVASWQMLDVISYMFRLPGPPVQKETLRGEMERLVESVAEIQGSEFQPELSPMSIPLTIAYRKIGPAGAFYDRMQATFKACCSALEDDLVSNDASSLQVLTKVLALLPGLESEARIACTLQFYIVTESSSTQETNVGIPTSAEYAALDSEGISAPAADRSKSTRSEEPSTDEGARNDHDGGAQFDFNDHWSIQCSGSCGKSLTGSSITQPKENQPKKNPSSDSNQMNALYLCYHCTNTVLCSSCYEERKKLFVPCSVEHKHIQAPAENWQGVREGRLVFQTDKPGSHILFTDWMKKLKKKWEEAWMKYWGDV